MPDKTGVNSVQDLLATELVSAIEFGFNDLATILQNDLDAWNSIVTDALGLLSDDTTERLERHNASSEGEMLRTDEYSAGLTVRQAGGSNVAYPLYKFSRNVGWTTDALKIATAQDLARQQIAIQNMHQRALYREVRRALYKPTNFTAVDELRDNQSLPVKRLYNADSDPIADGPFGETFAGATHQHYTAAATLTTAALDIGINNVLEHRLGASIQIVTTTSNVASFEALTGSYEPVRGVEIIPAEDANRPVRRADSSRNDNKIVGVYKGQFPVHVKPWGVANYALVFDANGTRPLKRRQREQSILRGLRMVSQSTLEPLRCDFFQAEFGFGVYDRSAAAVVQFNNATYQDPSI